MITTLAGTVFWSVRYLKVFCKQCIDRYANLDYIAIQHIHVIQSCPLQRQSRPAEMPHQQSAEAIEEEARADSLEEVHYQTACQRITASQVRETGKETLQVIEPVAEEVGVVEQDVEDVAVAATGTAPVAIPRQLHSQPTRTQRQHNHHHSPAVLASLGIA